MKTTLKGRTLCLIVYYAVKKCDRKKGSVLRCFNAAGTDPFSSFDEIYDIKADTYGVF